MKLATRARPVTATATTPPHRTSASEAASPIPVVRILRIQKAAVTAGTLVRAASVARGRCVVSGAERFVEMFWVGCMPVRRPSSARGGARPVADGPAGALLGGDSHPGGGAVEAGGAGGGGRETR